MTRRIGPVPDPRLRDVLLLAVGVGGLVLCITIMYLGMRAVMDVGGMCAEGGPYEIRQECPDGAPLALILGSFGLFGFGALALGAGQVVGGWGWTAGLAWTGLFAVLGWNFLEYGIIDPPAGETIIWGWLIPGIVFELMAFGPVLLGLGAVRSGLRAGPGAVARGAAGGRDPSANASPGSGRPGWTPPDRFAAGPGPAANATTSPGATVDGRPAGAEGTRAALAGVAALLAAASREAQAGIRVGDALDASGTPGDREPAAPGAASGGAPGAAPGSAEFTEGTQALLDRLERLADMRAQGLLDEPEYEVAKDAVLRELAARRT